MPVNHPTLLAACANGNQAIKTAWARWSVKYTATYTPGATGIAEFGLSAGGTATLSLGGRKIVSYEPGTGSTFTGLAHLTAGQPVSFELDATGLGAGGGIFGPPNAVSLTWAPQENLM